MIKSSSAAVRPLLFLGFDPGKDKCGLAIVDEQRSIYWHQVVSTLQVLATGSKAWQQKLQAILPPALAIILVDERYSSLEARSRYWELYPPHFWQKLIPLGLRQPPRPVDDIVAIVLVERFLAGFNFHG